MARKSPTQNTKTAEQARLDEARDKGVAWKLWGPYLSERQWGTVREDYSENGDAWNYFSHDQARSRAYHWGEDGLAGISDDKQRLCFALALWNGRDPILKERLFGLTNSQGNHGEDVKEYYFYLDATPTHSYLKWLYKYPQAAYPYNDLVETNRQRGRGEPEYELLDTRIFEDDRYFDVFAEYAKASPMDVLIELTLCNRGPQPAELHLLPTLWFRNVWSWWPDQVRPSLSFRAGEDCQILAASHGELGEYFLYCEGEAAVLFTENETNSERLLGTPNPTPYVKDGINDCVVNGKGEKVNPARTGSKAAVHYSLSIGAGESAAIRLRLAQRTPEAMSEPFGASFDAIMEDRRREADEFYRSITPASVGEDAARVMRSLECCGASSTISSILTNGWRNMGPIRCAPLGGKCGTANGSTCSTAMSSRCRTSGSIPGMPPGTWPSIPSRCPRSISISPSINSI